MSKQTTKNSALKSTRAVKSNRIEIDIDEEIESIIADVNALGIDTDKFINQCIRVWVRENHPELASDVAIIRTLPLREPGVCIHGKLAERLIDLGSKLGRTTDDLVNEAIRETLPALELRKSLADMNVPLTRAALTK